MKLSGKQLIGFQESNEGKNTFNAFNPINNEALPTDFYEATQIEINQAVELASLAFPIYRKLSAEKKAAFLDKIAEEILNLGDELIQRAMAETALPEARLQGERGRTIGQLKSFASLLREGSWVDARIDTAIPDRQPLPKPDIRQMLIPLGPVGVFGASNFPLAFSVAGGDTASALAAGCPVIVKAHPAHPGTSELVGRAIVLAAQSAGMPEGVFSIVQGSSITVGMGIVEHPLVKAIGFTGSFRGGKALFDAACRRPEPIPVYAEMGSTNPVFILPKAIAERGEAIAKDLAGSITLGVGQFCTNPGMFIGMKGEKTEQLISNTGKAIAQIVPGTMLTQGIKSAFDKGIQHLSQSEGVIIEACGNNNQSANGVQAYLLKTNASEVIKNPNLMEEVFGPSSLAIVADSKAEMLDFARKLQGHLTATIHATEEDLLEYAELIHILENKVGRLLFNGYPTGVEVCPSMTHGGPFPATTDSKSTSVGTLAIKRFVRPISYQNFPQSQLPDELKNENPLNIWRLLNGEFTKEKLS
jgi:NADP-dependent aldehyde dehydrogenase